MMKKLFIAFICLSLIKESVTSNKYKIPRIGIIGGGIGGTSCAYFLKSLFGKNGLKVDIDLYEADKVGGRLSTVEFSNNRFEEGGSIIHPKNKYMVDFLNTFNLKKRKTPNSYFALYDGKEYVFSESYYSIFTLLSVLWRYGLGIWKLQKHIEEMLTKFDRIYEMQNAGHTFPTVETLLAAMDPKFVEYLQISSRFGFEKEGLSKLVLDEVITSAIRVNYGQGLNIHKMVGSVAIAGITGDVWAVEDGNKQIPEKLLEASSANFINLAVTSVRKTSSGEVEIITSEEEEQEEEGEEKVRTYDIVVLATPQTSDMKHKIEFEGFDEEIRFSGSYHKTVCTLVEGTLGRTFRDLNPRVSEILTTKANIHFNSVGRISPVDYTPKTGTLDVWKVFSPSQLTDGDVSLLFEEVRRKHVKEWLAYPEYAKGFRNDSFVLAPNLYHVNAIEWAASAMEMSVIGAKNVALLAYDAFAKKQTDKGETELSGSERSEVKDEL